MQLDNLSNEQIVALLGIVLWDLGWKAFALWKSARNGHKGWFVVMLLINSVGILPYIYLVLNKSVLSPKL